MYAKFERKLDDRLHACRAFQALVGSAVITFSFQNPMFKLILFEHTRPFIVAMLLCPEI